MYMQIFMSSGSRVLLFRVVHDVSYQCPMSLNMIDMFIKLGCYHIVDKIGKTLKFFLLCGFIDDRKCQVTMIECKVCW